VCGLASFSAAVPAHWCARPIVRTSTFLCSVHSTFRSEYSLGSDILEARLQRRILQAHVSQPEPVVHGQLPHQAQQKHFYQLTEPKQRHYSDSASQPGWLPAAGGCRTLTLLFSGRRGLAVVTRTHAQFISLTYTAFADLRPPHGTSPRLPPRPAPLSGAPPSLRPPCFGARMTPPEVPAPARAGQCLCFKILVFQDACLFPRAYCLALGGSCQQQEQQQPPQPQPQPA
jgi:hypothetical protein